MTRPGARTIEDFCADTGLGRTTVYARARAGELVLRKSGRRTIILDSDAEAFLNGLPPVHAPKKKQRG